MAYDKRHMRLQLKEKAEGGESWGAEILDGRYRIRLDAY